jgi:serine/threonine protein kinase
MGGTIKSNPEFVSPEVVAGGMVTLASDMWSVGALTCEPGRREGIGGVNLEENAHQQVIHIEENTVFCNYREIMKTNKNV